DRRRHAGRPEFCQHRLSASRAARFLTSAVGALTRNRRRRGFHSGIFAIAAPTGCLRQNLNYSRPGRSMKMSPFRASTGLIFALAMLSLAQPSSAQQKLAPAAPPAVQQAPAVPQTPAVPAPTTQPVQAPAPSALAAPADGDGRL